MTKLTVAALQLAFGDDAQANIRNVSDLVRQAAGKGAQVVLPPELFEGPYFCREEDEGLFANAQPTAEHPSVLALPELAASPAPRGDAPPRRKAPPTAGPPSVLAMQALASELGIWIPTSFFELDGPHHYNSLAMVGPDGKAGGASTTRHSPRGRAARA